MTDTARLHLTASGIALPIHCLATGLSVAAVVYHQTMVRLIAGDIGVSSSDLWALSVATQAGYGTGLVLGLPLGDMLAPRRLISSVVFLLGISLLLLSQTSSLMWMCVMDYIVGMLSIGGQLLIAYTAKNSLPDERVNLIGALLSALFGGLLLSRVFSGLIAEQIGWREFYAAVGLVTCFTALALNITIRISGSFAKIGYPALVRSLEQLWVSNIELRRIALAGSCFFAALSGVWANIASLAQSTHGWSEGQVGLLAATSLAGLRAPQLAKMLQKHMTWSLTIVSLALCLALVSIVGFVVGGAPIVMIVLFLVTIDITVRSIHVVSQGRVLGIDPAVASRLNSLYMTVYFLGAAVGSWLSGIASNLFGWSGMFLFPGICATAGIIVLTWPSLRSTSG